MSLLTGLYGSTHGVLFPDRKLSDEHLTIAEVLQDAGYETVAFTDGGYVSSKFGYQGFDSFDEGYFKRVGGIETVYNKAVAWLRKNRSRPFFLFLHTYQPHCPYDPPLHYDIYSDKNYRGIVEVSGECNYDSISSQMTRADYLYVMDKYDGNVYYTDHFLGKLFKELKDLGVYNESIIVFTSDHGESFGKILLDHGNGMSHGTLHDEIVKVPLIIKAPMFPKNQIIDTQVESVDIMPTVLQLLGITVLNRFDGKSLVELVQIGSYDKTFAFSENSFIADNTRYDYKMIRNTDWKLIRMSQDDFELFDLKSDLDEQNNLAAERVEAARPLLENLSIWMDTQEEKSNLFSINESKVDDDLAEQLKALGYVN
jgi:arylsulfatase A-like enzyme